MSKTLSLPLVSTFSVRFVPSGKSKNAESVLLAGVESQRMIPCPCRDKIDSMQV